MGWCGAAVGTRDVLAITPRVPPSRWSAKLELHLYG